MPNDKKPDDVQLKLYALLVDQIQKYTTILWQFPTALLAANAFALDKFQAQPWMMLALATVDGVLTYAFSNLVRAQRDIIGATRAAEEVLRDTAYDAFIPKFGKRRGSPRLIIFTLWILSAVLLVFSLIKIYGQARQAA